MAILICAFAGAVLFHLRGSGPAIWSTFVARLVWAVGMTVLVVLASHYNWYSLITLPVFFGVTLIPWFQTIDLGRIEGNKSTDVALMVGRGVLWTGPAAAIYTVLTSDYSLVLFGLSGLLCPAVYELGWRTPINLAVINLRQGPEVGQVYFGALIGAALGLAY